MPTIQRTTPARPAHARSAAPRQAAAQPTDSFQASAASAPMATPPVLGQAASVPKLTADASFKRPSPQYLATEGQFFKASRALMDSAQSGDMLLLQMYEFQNNATHGDANDAVGAPGLADQQALLPALADAARRGVKVQIILDGSKDGKTGTVQNQAIVDYLQKAVGNTGNITIDYYPAGEVNIDHAKQLVHMAANRDGSFDVRQTIAGGSNYGNHTAANNDGGASFHGIDAVGSARIFFENQAHCRGQQVRVDAPEVAADAPVTWAETSPTSTGILDAMLGLLKQSTSTWIQQFVLTQRDVSKELLRMGPSAHLLFDSGESMYDQKNFSYMAERHVDAKWGHILNGGRLHRKEAVYLKGDTIIGGTIGSANATNAGLRMPYDSTWQGVTRHYLTNHEIDAVVRAFTSPDGQYSTLPLLQAMLDKAKENMAVGHDQPDSSSNASVF